MNSLPHVSIIIPCRNEEFFIGKCLDSILSNDYPKDKLEVLVVDGMSEDATHSALKTYTDKFSFIRVFDNRNKIVPTAMNIGIMNARGNIIIRMDAHNTYSADYISKCVSYLQEYDVDNVGGIWITLPGADTVIAQSIALALAHPFGVGNAYYRLGSKKPKLVDTVPFGCYKKDVFDRIGFFDEDLIRNQDDEFNARLITNGGKILLAPDIISFYHARDSLLKIAKMYFQYGYFKPLVARKIRTIITRRQLIPPAFILSLITFGVLSFVHIFFLYIFLSILLVHLSANIFFSVSIAAKKGIKYLFALPSVFITMHLSYGFGYLKGIMDFILLGKYQKKKLKDIPLSR